MTESHRPFNHCIYIEHRILFKSMKNQLISSLSNSLTRRCSSEKIISKKCSYFFMSQLEIPILFWIYFVIPLKYIDSSENFIKQAPGFIDLWISINAQHISTQLLKKRQSYIPLWFFFKRGNLVLRNI